MIKVLQIGMSSNIGGIETYLMQQFRNIDKTEIMYDFLNINNGIMAFDDEIKKLGGNVYNVVPRRCNAIIHYYQVSRLIYKNRNVYHAVTLNALGLTYIFPLIIAALVGIPIRVMHSHNGGYGRKNGKLRRMLILFNKIISKFVVNKYIACSELAGKWMFDNNRFEVLHNVVDLDKYRYNELNRKTIRKELQINDEDILIAHIGRFAYQKNQKFLIDVMHELIKEEPTAVLLLIGSWDGPDGMEVFNEVKDAIERYGLEVNVKLLGLRKDIDIMASAFDCFCLPSRFEGLPVTAIEMQSVGVPCVLSDTITKEVKISSQVEFLSLNNCKIWAEKILEFAKKEKNNNRDKLIGNGYSKENSILEVRKLYGLLDKKAY